MIRDMRSIDGIDFIVLCQDFSLRSNAKRDHNRPMKTALILRHIHFEDLGVLAPFLREQGYDVHYLDPALEDLPSIDAVAPDLMVVLGGPIGAFDDEAYPFLVDELQLIRRRLDARLPLLGICLGAQLIARALGAGVAFMGHKEIGFGALTLTPEGERSVLAALAGVPVLHWHGDQFEIPPGANLLAGTAACAHQAYAMGRHALALQFHLEADASRIERWLVGHACELAGAGVEPRTLREQAGQCGPALAAAARRCIGDWLEASASPASVRPA